MEWNIDREGLRDYRERSGWLYDEKLFVTEDQKYGLLFYNICEVRMCTYYGTLAVYGKEDLRHPLIELEPGKNRISFWYDVPFFYGPESDVIATFYGIDGERIPFLLLKPSQGRFAVLPFDFTSIYYGFREIEKGRLELFERFPAEIERCVAQKGCERKTGWVLRLDGLKWYPMSKIGKIQKKCRHMRQRALEKGQGGKK